MSAARLTGPERLQLVRDARPLKATGMTWADVEGHLGVTEGQRKAAFRDYDDLLAKYGGNGYGGAGEGDDTAAAAARLWGIEMYRYGKSPRPAPRVPVFNAVPVVVGNCLIVGDVHLPTSDYALIDQMFLTAHKLGLTQMVIAGDLINADVFTTFDHEMPPIEFEDEEEIAGRFLSRCTTQFERVVFIQGNHERRVNKRSKGQLDAKALARILSRYADDIDVSPYGECVIISNGQRWHTFHQRNYSKIKGRVGNILAQKYQSNVVVWHQHHVSKLMDDWGRYVVIDGGGTHDDKTMAYVQLTPSTSPVMTRGFVVIIDGVGHVFTPYEAFTDWRVVESLARVGVGT